MLRSVTIRNFKSFKDATIDLRPFTFVVGRNGSGKSNLASALGFASEAMELPLSAVFTRRGGVINVARRRPVSKTRTLSEQEVRLGIALEFGSFRPGESLTVPPGGLALDLGVDVLGEQETLSRARYAFEIVAFRGLFRVEREQVRVNYASGSALYFDRYANAVLTNHPFLKDVGSNAFTSNALALPFIGTLPDFAHVKKLVQSLGVYAIDPTVLREAQDPDAGLRLLPNGSNAASVLENLISNHREDASRLFQFLATVVPDILRITPRTTGRRKGLSFLQKWSGKDTIRFDSFNMSDGTLRALGLLLTLFQESRPKILVIEEPESSLHPAAAAALVSLFQDIRGETQFIVTTHSPEVLDVGVLEDSSYRVLTWNNGESRIGYVDGAAKAALCQHLASAGELYRMRILDAQPTFDDLSSNGGGGQQSLFEVLP